MNKPKSKSGISVEMNGLEAKQILREFSPTEVYLRNLVEKYVPRDTRKDVSLMDFTELRRHGYVIKGIAKKEVQTMGKSLERKTGVEQLSFDFR